jgi:hypoxanthine phosphoribosyltransferase
MEERDVAISKVKIEHRVGELGQQITNEYEGKQLVLVGVLNGAFIFLADLARAIDIDLEVDFIRVASYGKETISSGSINLAKDIELDLSDKHVLLVEDIIDTGLTMAWLVQHMHSKKAASVKICTLIDKHGRREQNVHVDYTGFTLNQGFLVGYGLDRAEKYRNLKEIYSLGK